MAARKLTRQDLADAAQRYKNRGRWGPADEIGTLNHTAPADIVAAARLVRKGKVISLALNFDQHGPQGAKSKYPAMGRVNPVHTMLRTGTDAYAAVLDPRGIRAADDMVVMPPQCGTQSDGLGRLAPAVRRLRSLGSRALGGRGQADRREARMNANPALCIARTPGCEPRA